MFVLANLINFTQNLSLWLPKAYKL